MKLLLCAAVATAACAFSPSVFASSPMGVFARVDSVEYEPTKDAATRVVIRGVFGLHQLSSSAFTYAAPEAGYMYYACPVGLEADCREQWADIEAAIAPKQCVGWGLQQIAVGTIRAAGTTPQDPDAYELGMGVSLASYAGGICPKLIAYPGSTTDAGVAIPPPPDPNTPRRDAGAVGTPVVSDAGAASSKSNPSSNETVTAGCSVASGKAGGSLLAAGLAAAALVLGRRRRVKGAR